MKALFIGGTGTISMAITKALAANSNWELYLLNRGTRTAELPQNVKVIKADINDEKSVNEQIKDMQFDTVCDFIGFELPQVERDFRLFGGKTRQYMYISSASAYAKPVRDYRITEGTSLANPHWEYSRNKIRCEHFLMEKYRNEGFPVTIVRPSHTYDERNIPLSIQASIGSWPVVKRMLEGKPVLIHGDGTTLWTVTHNSDFAKGFIGLMGNPRAIGEAFNITSDESLTWDQIYKAVADALGVEFKPYHVSSDFLCEVNPAYEGELLGDKTYTVVFDNRKLKNVVPDFVCTTRFEQGVRKITEYYLTHKESQRDDKEFDAFCDNVIETLEKAKKSSKKVTL
ncbi:MAG: SDR family oxidoreductase [Bacteroidales bacterium]|nr:SDR family oxidoreductase [Bacteroidales bacterium]